MISWLILMVGKKSDQMNAFWLLNIILFFTSVNVLFFLEALLNKVYIIIYMFARRQSQCVYRIKFDNYRRYIYIYMCVCVCVRYPKPSSKGWFYMWFLRHTVLLLYDPVCINTVSVRLENTMFLVRYRPSPTQHMSSTGICA